mgnify:FL=1
MPIVINGSGTVTGLSVGGINDGAIAHADLADSTKPVFCSYALLEDRKTSGTAGGTATSGAWYTRDLNTEIADPDSIVSISSNKFTLGAGSYLIKWRCPFYRTEYTQTRLYDVTNSAVIRDGQGAYFHHTDDGTYPSLSGMARVTPSGSTEYRIEYKCGATKSTVGLGYDATFDNEVYTQVEIYKEAS